eukprot:13960178-Ditylum_brightwellii.AAC.1
MNTSMQDAGYHTANLGQLATVTNTTAIAGTTQQYASTIHDDGNGTTGQTLGHLPSKIECPATIALYKVHS